MMATPRIASSGLVDGLQLVRRPPAIASSSSCCSNFLFLRRAVPPQRTAQATMLLPDSTPPAPFSAFAARPFCSRDSSGPRARPESANIVAAAASSSSTSEGTNKDWEEWLAVATSLYPVYMLVGGALAFWQPSAFAWFVKRGPNSYSAALGVIMLAMGFTLRIQDLIHVLTNRPLAVMFGFAAQYSIMPLLGAGLSRALGLSADLSAGLILMACCPGGTASNVVTYIARGDVPLSILMTICTTFAAVFTTPLLTSVLAGAYVPVDAVGLALSTLQVVLAPVVVGACMQTFFPQIVASITHFAPLVAVLVSSLLASSVFSANVPLLLASTVNVAPSVGGMEASMPPVSAAPSVLVNLGIIGGAVMIVHAAGFFLGYAAAVLAGFGEPQRRAVSIEVGMQNSSLGVVLATMHFASPLTAVPAAVSAVIMNIMGSGLAVVWRNMGFKDTSSQTGDGSVAPVAAFEKATADPDSSPH